MSNNSALMVARLVSTTANLATLQTAPRILKYAKLVAHLARLAVTRDLLVMLTAASLVPRIFLSTMLRYNSVGISAKMALISLMELNVVIVLHPV